MSVHLNLLVFGSWALYIQNNGNNADFYSTLATMGHNAHQQRCCNMLFCLFKALCNALTKRKSQLILVHRCENSRYVYVSPAEALHVGLLHAASVTMKKVNPSLLSCRCCPPTTPSTPIPTHSSQPNYLPCIVTCSRWDCIWQTASGSPTSDPSGLCGWSTKFVDVPPPPPHTHTVQPNYLPCWVTWNNSWYFTKRPWLVYIPWSFQGFLGGPLNSTPPPPNSVQPNYLTCWVTWNNSWSPGTTHDISQNVVYIPWSLLGFVGGPLNFCPHPPT